MVRLSAFAVSTGPNSAVLKVVMLVTAGRSVGNEATHLMLRPNSCRSLLGTWLLEHLINGLDEKT